MRCTKTCLWRPSLIVAGIWFPKFCLWCFKCSCSYYHRQHSSTSNNRADWLSYVVFSWFSGTFVGSLTPYCSLTEFKVAQSEWSILNVHSSYCTQTVGKIGHIFRPIFLYASISNCGLWLIVEWADILYAMLLMIVNVMLWCNF